MVRNNKYSVAPKEQRTWNGKAYDSKAEMEYAMVLDLLLKSGEIIDVIEQPIVHLGIRENRYRPDFLIMPAESTPYYVDVKGMETTAFKKNKRLWKIYGRMDLHLVKRTGQGKFKVTETVRGKVMQEI